MPCRVLLFLSLLFAAHAQRPNVILVMTDDQGYGDFGATGNTIIETPHLDAMAARSASLSNFYVSPVCSPTRASLMTGRYNYRTRCIDTWVGRSMMEPDETTVAEVLSQAGYGTGIFGKWHLGDCYPMRPMDQGFAESLIHRGGGLAQPADPRENNRRYTDAILFKNGEQVDTKGYCTDVYFDGALSFIEAQHLAEKNFFVYLPTNAPHGPFHDVPEDLRKHYMQKDLASLFVRKPAAKRLAGEIDKMARIAAMITNVDQNVGRLMAKLDALGIRDNTLVIFLVDNGPNGARYVGPFRGSKTGVHEGGVRSPLWLQWPDKLTPSQKSDELAAHIDLMPTILDACGLSSPKGIKLDGHSLLPGLSDKAEPVERSIVIQTHRGDQPQRYHHFMIRRGDWKLLHSSGFGRESFAGEPKFELYNIAKDAGETSNLYASMPSIADDLKARYDAWFDDVSRTRPDNYAPPRIHIGTPQERLTALTRQDWRGGSWHPNAIGHWRLHAKAGTYKLRVLFDPAQAPETLELRAGDRSVTGKVKAGADAHTFISFPLPAGELELHATLKQAEKSRGVYQIEVSKVE